MKCTFHIFLLLFFAVTSHCLVAQETFPVNGPRNTSHNYYVLKNANVVVSPGNVVENATLIIRDQRILSVSSGPEIPKNSVVYDLKGKWIYPSFIELDSDYGLSKSISKKSASRQPQYSSNKKGAYSWNQAIHPEINAVDQFHTDYKTAESLRKMGYGVCLSHVHDGIMRGTSVLVHLGNEKDNFTILKEVAGSHFSFSKGSSRQSYPSSQMGSIALLRQTMYDAQWYAGNDEKDEINLSLEALNAHKTLPVFFEADDYLSSLRADKIADEFKQTFIIKGSGDEYKRAASIKETEAPYIIPLSFPLPYNLTNSYDAVDLGLHKMKHWELAPFNSRILKDNEVQFAYTSKGVVEKDFWNNLRIIEKTGLSETEILEALTTIPSELIGMESEVGKIESGFYANFFIVSEPFLKKEAVVFENWVNGKRYVINEQVIDIRGVYNLNVNKNGGLILNVEGSLMNPKAKIVKGKMNTPVIIKRTGNEISLRYSVKSEDKEDKHVLLSGNINDEESRIWVGKGQNVDGEWVDWAAIKQKNSTEVEDSSVVDTLEKEIPSIFYPNMAYGFLEAPGESTVILKHATVWTNEEDGVLKNADVCISGGKIIAVGEGLSKVALFGTQEMEVEVIDAKGKHITCGIIDEHSHIAISRGVNEGGQAISAEVRIVDVINSDDINIYRQLAGGVTASQLLHGSANPIGGQSALVKLRWGSSPEEMKIKGADGFIKFALGENVKQSNWGDYMKIRYPQTRMGVEQVFYDGFLRAREYGEVRKIYDSGLKSKKNKKNPPIQPRKDLELDALLEILNKERFITCHSYVQSEINMLMHVADSMNFTVNTFTHILEGYKVADKMKAHGVGASTFSDWWAYKYEVNDAIPYNAAILSEQGIVTAINSDDAEMGRRLNQEASKAHKYGGISQEEAWKMVTLNPAKLLHLDDRMGSVKVGKDADIVLWTDNPLSGKAQVERTYVDGKCLYSVEKDLEMRTVIKEERSRLIQEMIRSTTKSGKSRKVKREENNYYHCDTLEEEEYEIH